MAVSVEELGHRVAEFGQVAFLVTTGGTGSHVVSVAVDFDGTFSMTAGSSSRRNIDAMGTATLLWPTPDRGPYSLIVDGDASTDGDRVMLRPTKAVLHRLADAPADLPSCVRIEQTADGG